MANPLPHCLSREISEVAAGRGGDDDDPGNGCRDRGTVSDRDGSDWEGQESHPSALQSASESGARPDCADIQEHHGTGDLSPKACCEAGIVGWGVLERRVLCSHGRGTGKLADRRAVCAAARAASRRSPAAPNVLVL